jgi:hypothetical protein
VGGAERLPPNDTPRPTELRGLVAPHTRPESVTGHLRSAAGIALVAATACAPPRLPPADQAAGLAALLSGATGLSARDTACVRVAAGAGERDPDDATLATLRRAAGTPHLIRASECPEGDPQGPGLVRLIRARRRGDTLLVDGDVVAEHLRRYECRCGRRPRPATAA